VKRTAGRWRRRLHALASERCPICFQGRMFRGPFTMNDACAVCGHRFMREQGFFQGGMIVSYGLALFEFIVLALVATFLLAPLIGLGVALTLVVLLHLALVPQLFRYSRVIWSHLNVGTLIPDNESE
jgi:uncharacterized protein (DUF983 family)